MRSVSPNPFLHIFRPAAQVLETQEQNRILHSSVSTSLPLWRRVFWEGTTRTFLHHVPALCDASTINFNPRSAGS